MERLGSEQMIRESMTIRLPIVALAVVLALSSTSSAHGEGSISERAISLRPLTALAGEDSNAAVWEPVFELALQRFFPPDVTSDYLVQPAPVAFILQEVIALSTSSPNILAHRDRFVILQGCRPHACVVSKGVIVVDTDTGDVCAALYRMSLTSDPRLQTDPLQPDPLPDKPTAVIDAEIFAPAPSRDTASLIELCAKHYALATQRLVGDGFWIEQGETQVRVAPEFQVDPAMAARFPVWHGAPQPY